MRRRILLVDDEVAVLLTLKAVLEISGFEVDTAASAREGVSKLHTREYQMLITDMRMEHDVAGVEVIKAARAAAYHPAVALLTAFPCGRGGLAGDGRRPASRQAHAYADSTAADRRPDRVARAKAGATGRNVCCGKRRAAARLEKSIVKGSFRKQAGSKKREAGRCQKICGKSRKEEVRWQRPRPQREDPQRRPKPPAKKAKVSSRRKA